MANLVESLGYGLGKVHAGMLAHVCNLQRDGEGDPLDRFLGALQLSPIRDPHPIREWRAHRRRGNRIDLAVFDVSSNEPKLVVEIKVDDRESTGQTARYTESTANVPVRLFVTLGFGEFHRPPESDGFRWVRLQEFSDAIKKTVVANPKLSEIQQWGAALENELDRWRAVAENDRRNLDSCRTGSWNIVFLGQLKEELLSELPDIAESYDPSCYTTGSAPDTILNFGWKLDPLYLEINNNGTLNLKLSINGCTTPSAREDIHARTSSQIRDKLQGIEIRPCRNTANSMTLASIDVGILAGNGFLTPADSRESIIEQLGERLRKLA